MYDKVNLQNHGIHTNYLKVYYIYGIHGRPRLFINW